MIYTCMTAVDIHFKPSIEKLKKNTFEGIPTIEKTKKGRFFISFYVGETDEGPGNCVIVKTRPSSSGRPSNYDILFMIEPPESNQRTFDPCLWIDKNGSLWLFYAQSTNTESNKFDHTYGVWFTRCDNPDSDFRTWTRPVRICDGVLINKPIIQSNGEWLLPVGMFEFLTERGRQDPACRFTYVYSSSDGGQSFSLKGKARMPGMHFDETHIVERRDGRLWLLARGTDGLIESFSSNGGLTWSVGVPSRIPNPCTRFFIRRLRSGNLLLVNHFPVNGVYEKKTQIKKNTGKKSVGYVRNNLYATLSRDDGRTWEGRLVIDERDSVSYPDGVQDDAGRIYIVYDRLRYDRGEILMASFTEEEIKTGKTAVPDSYIKEVVHDFSMWDG